MIASISLGIRLWTTGVWEKGKSCLSPSSAPLPMTMTRPRSPAYSGDGGGNVILTPGRGSVEKLDRLPSPLRMGLLQPRNEPIVPYETMRGCAYSCSYCITGTIPSRFFPADRVVEEISLLYEYRVSGVRLVCSNFLLHPEFFAICREVARINADRSMSFTCFSYAGDITREKTKALKACNFETVEIGLQTVNATTLKTLRRPPFNESRFLEGLAHLRDAGIYFSIDLIAGLPGESIQDVEKSIAFLKKHGVREYNVFPLQLLPGSPLRKKAKEMGIEADTRPPYRVTGTPSMTQAQIHSCVSKEQIERKDFFFELAQEFWLPRFCTFKHTGNPASPPRRIAAPVTKLLVSPTTNIQRFAETAVRRFGANVVMIFSNPGQRLTSLSSIIEAVCHANPFCRIMPVFKIRTSAELDDVLQLCRRISLRNLVNKTVVKDDSFSGEEVALPKDFTLYEEIHIGSLGDMERVSNRGISNILIDISPQLDPVPLRSALEQFVTAGKNIQYKNFALYYLDYQIRQRQLGKPERIHTPVDVGNMVTLDADGELAPHLSMSSSMALEIAHMQMLFMRRLGSTTANSNTRSFV